MDESNETAEVVPSLRDRARRYVTAFLAGLGVSAGVGLIIGFVKGGSIWNASGYTVMLLGVVMLLVGGVAAGGHSHLSAGSTVEAFEKRGVRSENRHLDESEIASLILDLFSTDIAYLQRMTHNAAALARPEAALTIAQKVCELVE